MILLESNQNHATAKETEICTTLAASMGMGGGYVPMIVEVLPFDTTQVTSPMNYSTPHWGDPCHPLASNQHPPAVVIEGDNMEAYCIGNGQLDQLYMKPIVGALNCMHDQQAVLQYTEEGEQMGERQVSYGLDRASYNQGKNAKYNFSVEEELIGAQVAKGPGAVGMIDEGGDAVNSVVRRLTPLE